MKSLSGKQVILDLGTPSSCTLEVGRLISDEGTAQVVYHTILDQKDLVIKILRETQQKEFQIFENTEFDVREFLQTCLESIKKCIGITLPPYSQTIWISSHNGPKLLGFLQTYLGSDFTYDEKALSLPDLGIIESGIARGFIRPLNFQEGFYFRDTGKLFFADRDRYFLQLIKIAKKKDIKTKKDLERFAQEITQAWKN